jgi:hypothetical protein
MCMHSDSEVPGNMRYTTAVRMLAGASMSDDIPNLPVGVLM